MAETRKLVVVLTRGLDDERSHVAWTIANAGVASGMQVLMFLVSSGVDWARRGAADVAQLNPLDAPMGELIGNFCSGGGTIQICPPCAKVRGYAEGDFIDGVIMAGAAAMIEWVARGAATLTF